MNNKVYIKTSGFTTVGWLETVWINYCWQFTISFNKHLFEQTSRSCSKNFGTKKKNKELLRNARDSWVTASIPCQKAEYQGYQTSNITCLHIHSERQYLMSKAFTSNACMHFSPKCSVHTAINHWQYQH